LAANFVCAIVLVIERAQLGVQIAAGLQPAIDGALQRAGQKREDAALFGLLWGFRIGLVLRNRKCWQGENEDCQTAE
jgi:hypothetical protein